MARRARHLRWLGASSGIALLTAGCQDEVLTRQPVGDTHHAWMIIWIAVGAVGVSALALALVAWGQRAGPRRMAGSGVWFAVAIGALVLAALFAGTAVRRQMLLTDGKCRPIPPAARPASFVDISCGDFAVEAQAVLPLVVLAAVAIVIGRAIAGADARTLWVPAAAFAAGAVGSLVGLLDSIDDRGDGTFIACAIALALTALPAACLLSECLGARRSYRRAPGLVDTS